MDRKWSKVATPEENHDIPRLPTREEEIAYLDKFEKELRNQPYSRRKYHPDPARKAAIEFDEQWVSFKAHRLRKMSLTAVLFSPIALWLAEKSPAKACPTGIPYRSYPLQYKIRFWSFFLLYDLTFAWAYFYYSLDKDFLEREKYPLHKIRERQL